MQICIQSTFKGFSSVCQFWTLFWSPKFKVSSDTHGNFLILTPYKIKMKQQLRYIQHTMSQTLYYYSIKEETVHNEEILHQSKTENRPDKLQSLHLYVWCKSPLWIFNPFQLCWLQQTSLSWADSIPWLQLFLTGILMILATSTSWGLQENPGFSVTVSWNGSLIFLSSDTPDTILPQ